MRLIIATMMLGFAQPVLAQSAQGSPPPARQPADEKEIVVTGLADGARVVEVDYDKVWKTCAECKRALAKLDKLARSFRDERTAATLFASAPGAHCGDATPSSVATFQRSSAETVGTSPPAGGGNIVAGLCAARAEDQSRRTLEAVTQRFVAPEQPKLIGHMRAFLAQLTPHIVLATEAERVAHGASAGLVDTKRTKLSARNLKRIDVTDAVIRRLDASEFTIVLPDPPAPGPAHGGYEPIKR